MFSNRTHPIVASLVLVYLLCVGPVACGSGTLETGSLSLQNASYLEEAGLGAKTLQTWYNSNSGLYNTGWWHSANAITTLVDYERIAKDTSYLSVIANTFARAQTGSSGHPNFTNTFYDDTGWWGLAWIDAYDLTGNQAYLSMAEATFAYMEGGWDSTCGGGIWWSTARTYKNAIANELFLTMAAKLANRTSGEASAAYLAWAQKEWTWFLASGMINKNDLINDGLNSTNPNACKNNNGITWSYNQGVILGGLVELSHATSDPTLLTRAASIADAVLSPNSGMLTSNGILVDHSFSGGDAPQFKGIFVRNLGALYAAAPDPKYKSFVDANANSIWVNDNSGTRFGALWQGPVDSTDASRQSSALDALVAAATMQ